MTKSLKIPKGVIRSLFFFDLRLLITPFGIFKLFAIVLSVLLRFTASDYPFGIFKLFAIVLSVLLRFTASDYPLWYLQTFRQHSDEKFEDTKGGNQKP
jgi:hypothetical protein